MPKGPKGQKRPADVIGTAIKVAKIATGEIKDEAADPAKDLMRRGGKKGGRARAKKLSPERRSEIARIAALARWKEKVISD